MKKRLFALILAGLMVFGIVGCGKSSASAPAANGGGKSANTENTETKELKLGHPLGPSTSQHIYLQKWADAVYEASNGKYKISVYPSAQFGEARELVESLSNGIYDVGWVDSSTMDFLVPEANMLYLAFFFEDYEELWKAIDGNTGARLAEITEEKGNIHLLSAFSLGCREIFSNKEIVGLDSLKNLKFRVPELDMWINTFKVLGMNPTPVAWSELYTALASKVVDGACANWETIAGQKMYKEAPYIWESNHFFQTGFPAFNFNFWNSLSDEDKQMFTDTCFEIAKEQRANVEELDKQYKQSILDDGGHILERNDFTDIDEVIDRYQNGLWKTMVEEADAQELYEIMCEDTGKNP